MTNKTCLIISGGDFSALPDNVHFDHVIACDRGLKYAEKMNVRPDTIIGDFDSIEETKAEEFVKRNGYDKCEIIKFPSRKDDSDTMLAVKHALVKGYDHLVIVCALGGRFDHTLANIQCMAYAAEQGAVKCELIGDSDFLTVIKDSSIVLKKKEGYSLSVFSLSGQCTNVKIKGSAYDVDGITLSNTYPLGLSNEYESDEVFVSVGSGILLITESGGER